MAAKLPGPSEWAQAPEQSGENVFAFGGAADDRLGRAALVVWMFFYVCLFFLLL